MPEYKELNREAYLRIQKVLLKEKGSDDQRLFLNRLKDNDSFLSFFADEVGVEAGEVPPLFEGALTESSFKDLTQDQEKGMYDIWKVVAPKTACRVSFWAGVTLEHIHAGRIAEASWLAANGGITESGEERIDHALSIGGDQGIRSMDNCVRTALRRMSGLPEARGNRSVFVDAPFARAYWRERLVTQILESVDGSESRDSLLEVVRNSQAYWESLVTMIVSRSSVYGAVEVQSALVNSLAKLFESDPNTPLRSAEMLRSVLRRLSNIAAAREISVLEFDETSEIVDGLLAHFAK